MYSVRFFYRFVDSFNCLSVSSVHVPISINCDFFFSSFLVDCSLVAFLSFKFQSFQRRSWLTLVFENFFLNSLNFRFQCRFHRDLYAKTRNPLNVFSYSSVFLRFSSKMVVKSNNKNNNKVVVVVKTQNDDDDDNDDDDEGDAKLLLICPCFNNASLAHLTHEKVKRKRVKSTSRLQLC